MRFLVEIEGPLFDVASAYFAAHQAAATIMGWSRLDRGTFWRLYRTKGRDADFLPGAKPVKIAEHQRRFEERIESNELTGTMQPQPAIADVLGKLLRHGPCHAVTLGANLVARREAMERGGLLGRFGRVEHLNADPRCRPAELRALAEGDSRAIVIAGTDALVRAAQSAELFAVGVSNGPCAAARLHQAGASVVYKALAELVDSLQRGAPDLVKAGLLPMSFG